MARNLSPQENEAVYEKVLQLIGEGYELDQATAIAFDMLRRGKIFIPRTRKGPNTKSFVRDLKSVAAILASVGIISKKPRK